MGMRSVLSKHGGMVAAWNAGKTGGDDSLCVTVLRMDLRQAGN